MDEVESTKLFIAIILDVFSAEKYSNTNFQAIRDPDLRLNEIESIMKTIFINHSDRLSVTKICQESNRKGRHRGRELAMCASGPESLMFTAVTYQQYVIIVIQSL